MKHNITVLIMVFATLSLMISCSGNKNNTGSNNSKHAEKQSVDSVNKTINSEAKKKKSKNGPPKVLTYTEIVEKNEELLKDYEESKLYSSDTIVKRNKMNKSFNSYLTTQLRYMLSSELKLLRNEFFARKGYKFKSNELYDYFNEYNWYNGKIEDVNKIRLSSFEKAVIDSIKAYEKANYDLDEEILKKTFRDFCKKNVKNEYGDVIIEIPSILFRRNIGYQIKGMPDHNKHWFNGEYLRVEVIDTLNNDNLLLGLFGQILCPAEFCLMGGEIVTCDSSLNYLDSKSVEFETIDYSQNDNDLFYKFNAPSSGSTFIVRVDNDGKIQID